MAANPPGLTAPVLRANWVYCRAPKECAPCTPKVCVPCTLHRDLVEVRGHEACLRELDAVTRNIQESTEFRSSDRSRGRGNSSELWCALAKRGKLTDPFAPADHVRGSGGSSGGGGSGGGSGGSSGSGGSGSGDSRAGSGGGSGRGSGGGSGGGIKVTEAFRCYDCYAMIRLGVVPVTTSGSKEHIRTCADCSRTFQRFGEGQRHMRRQCTARTRTPSSQACRMCGKFFKTLGGLRGHDDFCRNAGESGRRAHRPHPCARSP